MHPLLITVPNTDVNGMFPAHSVYGIIQLLYTFWLRQKNYFGHISFTEVCCINIQSIYREKAKNPTLLLSTLLPYQLF